MSRVSGAIRQSEKPHTILGVRSLIGLITFVFLVLLYDAFAFSMKLDDLQTAKADNRIWVISQVEVDYQKVLASVLQAKLTLSNPESSEAFDANSVTLLFDIFYSRIDVVSTVLRAKPGIEDLHGQAQFIKDSATDIGTLLDTADLTDISVLNLLEAQLLRLQPSIRNLVISTLNLFVQISMDQRQEKVAVWSRFVGTTVILLAVMAIALLIAFRLSRRATEQVRMVAAAADTVRMVYDSALSSIISMDVYGRILSFNPASEMIFERTEADTLGKNIADILIPEHRHCAFHESLKNFRKMGHDDRLERGRIRATSLRADGTEFPIELAVRANKDIHGRTTIICFIRDVSEQIAYEASMRDAKETAERHAQAKSSFLAVMSHELRTPIHGLIASLDLIQDDRLDPETTDLISTARDCATRSLMQVNDVLEVTRLDDASETPTPFSPARTVARISHELQALANDYGNQLNLSVTGAMPDVQWLGMPKTFVRAMYNLMGNAIKFTKNGWVTVTLTFTETDDKRHRLMVCVEDTGVGIPAKDLSNIFELFFTNAESSEAARRKSTGLGLPIARIAVEKMGGQLAVESEVGVGSKFYFEIPLEAYEGDREMESEPEETAALEGLGLRCLVVDDNTTNALLTARMIQRLGFAADHVLSGEEAVQSASLNKYDIIFMDINMPGGMDGLEATSHIRNGTKCAASIIVAMTADTTFGADARPLETQLDYVLHKPFRFTDLASFLSEKARLGDFDMLLDDSPAQEQVKPEFGELFDLVGLEDGLKLLQNVLSDIDIALEAALTFSPEAGDFLHRAIGSTAMVGLLQFGLELQKAENLLREDAEEAFIAFLPRLKAATIEARQKIAAALSDHAPT
jgi:PAS domain S-box-containing protein